MHDEPALGAVGELTIGTRGARGPGEALLRVSGGTEAYIAWSEHVLPRGTRVLAVTRRGPREVDVVPWPDDPLEVPAGEAP